MIHDLLAMLNWLNGVGCTHIAMESASYYWRSVYNFFEGNFELLVGNAYHMKTVPGRKTNVKDTEWIGELPPWPDSGKLHPRPRPALATGPD